MRYDYRTEHMQDVTVCGILCEFNDMRIDHSTVPEGKYQYEVADGGSDGEPARVKKGIFVDFFGTLICDQELPLGPDGVLWLEKGDWVWS